MSETILENFWNPININQGSGRGKSDYKISTYEVSSSWYNAQLVNTGDRLQRLKKYHEMDKSSVEIGRALDILAEDISSSNADDEEVFKLEFPDESKVLKTTLKVLNDMLDVWADRTLFGDELYTTVRKLLKYGSVFYRKNNDGSLSELPCERIVGYALHPDDEHKVMNFIYDPNVELIINEGKTGYQRHRNVSKEMEVIPANDLVFLKIGDGVLGESILERIYTVWRQMTLLEDSVVIYRVVRAPERRVYYIDVGNLQGPKREQAIERQKMRLMQKQANRKGMTTTDYDPNSTSEDIFIPTNSNGKGSRIETLQGGSALGEVRDILYFGKKLAMGLRIPFSMIDVQGDEQQSQHSDMRVGQVYAVEMRYMGYVRRIARAIANELHENYKFFIEERNVVLPKDCQLKINPPMSFAIYKEMELQQSQLNIYMSTTNVQSMSKRYAMQEFLHMDHDKLDYNEQEKMKELGLTSEQIKKMDKNHISNIVYGDGRFLEKYGITKPDPMGY